jgi:hypothetical protein
LRRYNAARNRTPDSGGAPRQFPFRNGEIKLEFVHSIGISNARVSKALKSLEFKYFQCRADDRTRELPPGSVGYLHAPIRKQG